MDIKKVESKVSSFVPNNTKTLKIFFNVKSNYVYTSQGLTDYLALSYLIKLTMVRGGVAAVYVPSIQSKRFVVFFCICIFAFLSTVAPSVLKDCFSGGRGKQLKNNNNKKKKIKYSELLTLF